MKKEKTLDSILGSHLRSCAKTPNGMIFAILFTLAYFSKNYLKIQLLSMHSSIILMEEDAR